LQGERWEKIGISSGPNSVQGRIMCVKKQNLYKRQRYFNNRGCLKMKILQERERGVVTAVILMS
jgi:hypothetical protein